MDRLTREMAEVSKATETGDPKRAGYSLGITRKTIEKRKPLRNELNGIEGLPVRKRQKRSQHSSTSSPTGGPGRRKGWREPASQETVGYTSREAPHDSGYSEHLHSNFSKSHSQFSDAPFDSPSYYAKLRFPSETNSDMLPFVREVDEEYMVRRFFLLSTSFRLHHSLIVTESLESRTTLTVSPYTFLARRPFTSDQ
jgi:hypothetical protein